MNALLKHKVFFFISFILLFIQANNEAYASHAQSADITYECLGGNQYRINLSFYRDCAGVAAPNTATIDVTSATCGQNLTLTLNQIPGTGIDVTPICASMTTQCSGGSYPGVQEWKYTGVITLPMACVDWVFSFNLCCRNAAISTIVAPSSENIYVEATLNNLDFPCNNSPTFSNAPIPFVCIGNPYCFNNGSADIDGDSISYTLIAPRTGPTTTVTYIAPYSAAQPLLSSPLVSFDNVYGDMCMTPTQLEVTVFAVLVQEWRAEVLVGSVMRDIQLKTITCTNSNPYVNGINNTGQYTLTACAGIPINFNISAYDVDSTQNVTINWNNAIAGATFVSSGGSRPTGSFSWTPTAADIAAGAHCFTITVRDDNCPYNGTQTFSFCITVTGTVLSTTSTPANCGAANGSASVQIVSGTGPFSYQWIGAGTNANQTGLAAGTYTVNVTAAGGCISSATAVVTAGATPAALVINSSNINCYGANDGTATATVTGGLAPYTYLWSNGANTASISGLAPGAYSLTVTTANGCTSNIAVNITQPSTPVTNTISQTNVSCFGLNNGTATVLASGGAGAYTFNWNTVPAQTTATATNLIAGTYSLITTDANGCSASSTISITQPPVLNANAMVVNQVTCYGFADGFATVGASGGTGIYTYTWMTSPLQYTQNVNGLAPGNYFVTVTDANACTANSFVTITEPPALTLSAASFPATCNGVCDGQTVVIPAGGTPTYHYQWLPTGGTSASANGLCPGTYSVTVTDDNGCSITSTLSVIQPSPIVVNASGSTTICLGQNTTITAAASGGVGSYSYNWMGVGAGAVQTVSPATPSTYTVIATDANGCAAPLATVSINVTSLTASNLSVSGATAICSGTTANVSSAVTGSTGPVTINWSGGLGSGNGPFVVSPSTTTTYTVTVTDACGNFVTSTVPVVVNPLPVINLSPQSATACEEVVLNFVDNSTTNTGASYYWDFGDGFYSNQVSPSHPYTSTGTYTVTVQVTSPFGCQSNASTSNTVVVNAPSRADFVSQAMDGTTISPVYKFNNQSSNATVYAWDFGDGSSSSAITPTHTYAVQGEYTVKLITYSNAGCKDSAQDVIQIKPLFTIYIPNAFTPNGDNTNDAFAPKGAEISEFTMMIFDRWGELIYQTDDIQNGWDGKSKGGSKVSENGVYVYKITVRDFEERYHDYTGHVTLLAAE